jgi:hypothetical protein
MHGFMFTNGTKSRTEYEDVKDWLNTTEETMMTTLKTSNPNTLTSRLMQLLSKEDIDVG